MKQTGLCGGVSFHATYVTQLIKRWQFTMGLWYHRHLHGHYRLNLTKIIRVLQTNIVGEAAMIGGAVFVQRTIRCKLNYNTLLDKVV